MSLERYKSSADDDDVVSKATIDRFIPEKLIHALRRGEREQEIEGRANHSGKQADTGEYLVVCGNAESGSCWTETQAKQPARGTRAQKDKGRQYKSARGCCTGIHCHKQSLVSIASFAYAEERTNSKLVNITCE